jgi:hypothetical protein
MGKVEHLLQVKRELAEKYQRRAKQTKSAPQRRRYENKVAQYRWQIKTLEEQLA